MTEHKKRAAERSDHSPPINFTCGVCGKVHAYEEGYPCADAEDTEEE